MQLHKQEYQVVESCNHFHQILKTQGAKHREVYQTYPTADVGGRRVAGGGRLRTFLGNSKLGPSSPFCATSDSRTSRPRPTGAVTITESNPLIFFFFAGGREVTREAWCHPSESPWRLGLLGCVALSRRPGYWLARVEKRTKRCGEIRIQDIQGNEWRPNETGTSSWYLSSECGVDT